MATVVCQYWLESERGWGQRDDGWSLHLTEADRKVFVEEYWNRMPKEVPDEYSRPDGDPKLIDLSEDGELYQQLLKSKNGIRSRGDPK